MDGLDAPGRVQALADVRVGVHCRPRRYPGRRRGRALGGRTPAAGPGRVGRRCRLRLIAWGLGTEAPTAAEVQENIRQQIDLMRKRRTQAPATAGTETPAARRIDWFFRTVRTDLVSPVAWMVIGVPWRLRHPRRLTMLAIAMEAPNAVFYVLRAVRAVQRRRPRMAAGSALVAAGSVARLRAASAEPLWNPYRGGKSLRTLTGH